MNKDYLIIVRGRVQGVGFRWSAQQKAVSLGITGYVKNQADNSVLICIEGPPDKIDHFIDWCKRSPARSGVTSVDVEENELQNYKSFEIKV